MAESHNTSFLGTLSMPPDAPDAEAMIKADHVTMVFNIASEQLNSLKEYAIALSRKELRFKEFRALDDVSFEVKRGDVFGILGTNGSGKSTILKIISGVLEPTRGTCYVKGSIAPLIELGAGFDLELTARENIFLNGALLGYSKKFIQQHFDEIVNFAEVRDFLDMPMKNYSSGMVARIAFAIATVIVPDVLIVDEVLSVGDFMFQQKCEQRIQDLIKEHNVTVLIVSHNNAQIERLCNKAAWIEKGHLRAIGSASEVCRVYRAVGGKSGSAESEMKVLAALGKIKHGTAPHSPSISGENRYGTAAKMATHVECSSKTVLLTNSDFGRENYLAGSLAGLADGIMLTTQQDRIPDPTVQELLHIKPDRVIIVGDEAKVATDSLSSYISIDNHVQISRIAENGPLYGFEMFRFAESNFQKKWGDAMILASEPCDSALVTLGPFIFNNSLPVFFIDDVAASQETLRTVAPYFDRCIVLAEESKISDAQIHALNQSLEIIRFDNSDSIALNDSINEWIDMQLNLVGCKPVSNIVITSPNSTIDNYCLAPLSGRLNAKICFADPLSLDSVAGIITKLENDKSATNLTFIGNELRFNQVDKAIFENALRKEMF